MADLTLDNDRISAVNSSSTPLGADGVFTGTSEDVSGFPTVTVSIYADVGSAIDGLSVQFSADGTNWDHKDAFTIPAATGKVFTVSRVARYFRMVYTNGSTAQSAFRLQVILNESNPKPSSHRLGESINGEDDAELVKAVVTGEDPQNTGVFRNVGVNTDGSLNVVPLLNPPAPANTTPVNISAFGQVASTSGVDTYYTITNAKTLTIQTFLAGAEETTGGSIVSLFYDPNGNLSVLTRISSLFVNGVSDNAPVAQNFVGNGTRRIVLRRRGYTTSSREMFGQWIGYES